MTAGPNQATRAALGTWLRLFVPITWRDLLIVGYSVLVDRRLLSALAMVWKARRRTSRKRRIIQARRRVAEREIRGWFRDTPAARPAVAIKVPRLV